MDMAMWDKCLCDSDMQSKSQTDILTIRFTRTQHHNPDTASTLQLDFLC
jgi:hypothetical protein